MSSSIRQTITPTEWDSTVRDRIQTMREEWNGLSVDDRFWLVFNWLKEYWVLDPTKGKRQLFMSKPYWQSVSAQEENC